MSAPALSGALVSRPFSIRVSALATAFLAIGLGIVLFEALFFYSVAGLAHSPYGFRALIGFHLYPSEIWFLIFGNSLTIAFLAREHFRFPRAMVARITPLLVPLAAYCCWFVYGAMVGNSWALQEFREMVFQAMSLPAILYIGARADFRATLEWFAPFGVTVTVVFSAFGVHNSVLTIAAMFVAYYAFRTLYSGYSFALGLVVAMVPFFLQFEKPMVALLLFTLALSFLLAGHCNPQSVNWILSRFKLRILSTCLSALAAVMIVVLVINHILDGVILDLFRFNFLKQRVSTTGIVSYGDLTGGRWAIWQAAIDAWLQRPLFGYGLGSFIEAYSTGWVVKYQFHNYAIQALHHTGIVGFLLIVGGWLVWLISVVRRVRRELDVAERVVMAAALVYVCGMLFYGLYGHSLSFPPSAQLFWICVGVLSVERVRL